MEVIYSGVHAEVEIPGAGVIAERDVPVNVPDRVAEGLLAQDCWSAAKPAKADAKAGA